MKKLLFIMAVVGLMAGYSGKVMGQGVDNGTDILHLSIPLVHTLSIPTTITNNIITVTDPIGGAAVADKVFEGNSLNYTSIVAVGTTNTITANIDVANVLPAGTELYVSTAASATGGDATKNMNHEMPLGTGNFQPLATGVAAVDLTPGTAGAGVAVVTTIPSCYTGIGNAYGNKLTYMLKIVDYSKVLKTTPTTINVIYTIALGGS